MLEDTQTLELLNGLNWGKVKSSTIARKYILETDKSITTGNKIDRIRLNGFNTCHTATHTDTIRSDIKREIAKKRCVVLGTTRSCDHKTERDHKDGRKNDPRVMNTTTQIIDDFLSHLVNQRMMQKDNFVKSARKQAKDMMQKIYGLSCTFYKGYENYTEELKVYRLFLV